MELLGFSRVLIAVTCVMLQWLSFTSSSSDDHCEFLYTKQPSRVLNCTPQENTLSLVCEVQSSTTESFAVLWYTIFPDQNTPVLLQDGPYHHHISSSRHGNTTISNLSISLRDDDPSSSSVFCQIQLRDDSFLLERSQVFIFVSSSHSPSLPPCTPTSLVDVTPKCVLTDVSSHVMLLMEDDVTTDTMTSDIGTQPGALYSIIAVIIVSLAVIITLSILIVLLYKRKCGRGITRTADEGRSSMSSYGGFTNRSSSQQLPEGSSSIKSEPHPPPPSSSSSSSFKSYHLSDVPPPRPPKPQLKLTDRNHTHDETYPIQNRNGTEYGMEINSENLHNADTTGMRTLDINTSISNSDARSSKLGGGYREEVGVVWEDGEVKGHTKGKVRFTVLQPSSTGNYERSPTYQSSASVVPLTPPHKYSGDYERDYNYMSQLAGRGIPCSHEMLPRPPPADVMNQEGTSEDRGPRTDKYRGDYERSETYVLPPPLTHHHKLSDDVDVGTKYSGNYERAPSYTEWLLSNNVVPSCHEYTTLETATRLQTTQYYATPTQDHPPPSSSNSSSDGEEEEERVEDHCSIDNPLYSDDNPVYSDQCSIDNPVYSRNHQSPKN